METGIRVLVVDDEKMIREAVGAYFTKMGCHVLEAEDGVEALRIFSEEPVDFIILDLMLPGKNGEAVCEEIRATSRVPILMLTAKTQEESVIEGFGLGADDYVTKPFSVKELYVRMEAILRRTGSLRQEATLEFAGGLVVYPQRMEVTRQGEHINLTKSEWNILLAMARHPKKVFTREELMTIAFGEDTESLDRAIDTHIKNLRKKMEADPKQPVYVQTVHGLGYKFGGERYEKNTP